jgi:hypothetical protein
VIKVGAVNCIAEASLLLIKNEPPIDSPVTGTYRGSYTWWEAAILRPNQVSRDPSPFQASPSPTGGRWIIRGLLETFGSFFQPNKQFLGLDSISPFQLPHPDDRSSSPWPGHTDVEYDGNDRWLIQRNVTSSSQVRQHEIIWDQNSMLADGDEDADVGKGCGKGFLDALRPGDSIAVVARALVCIFLPSVVFSDITLFRLVSRLGQQSSCCFSGDFLFCIEIVIDTILAAAYRLV